MAILSMLQIILLWCFVVDSQGGGDSLPCISKLMPCQPYLKRSSPPPPPTCCLPLNQIVADDRQCVCAVFNNVAILKSFNVTQDDALNLAKTCGANPHHTSLCGKAAAPSGSPSAPATASTSTNSSTTPRKGAATTVYHIGGSLGLAAVLSLTTITFLKSVICV